MSFFAELQQRRIVPIVGAYVAGTWLLVEISSYIVDRYLLSPYISDIMLWGLLSLIPAVFLIAWTHGQPGQDKVTRAEKVGIPINVIATVGLLLTFFGSKDLGAAAEAVMVENEAGEQEMVYVPKAQYRKRILLFSWENQTGSDALDWWQVYLPDLIDEGTNPSPFVATQSLLGYGTTGLAERLRSEGFIDTPPPLALQRRLAREYESDYFINGVIAGSVEAPELTLRLFELGRAEPVKTFSAEGGRPPSLLVGLVDELLSYLEVPQGGARLDESLPLDQVFSRQSEANQHYIAGMMTLARNNDYAEASAQFSQALVVDSEFALAQIAQAAVLANSGEIEASRAQADAAISNGHRLNSHLQTLVRKLYYQITGDIDRQRALLQREVKLQDSAPAYLQLAFLQTNNGEFIEAENNLLAALERDPSNHQVYGQLADVSRAQGEGAQSKAYLESWIDKDPDAADAYQKLGGLLLDEGDISGAEAAYLEASIIEPDAVTPLLKLATLAAAEGNWGEARNNVEAARGKADRPTDRAAVISKELMILMQRGQMADALDLLEPLRANYSEFAPPIQIVFGVDTIGLSLHSQLGDHQTADELLQISADRLDPPYDQFLKFGEAMIAAEKGELDRADAAIDVARQVFAQFGMSAMEPQIDYAEATIYEKKGLPDQALDFYTRAINGLETSVLAADMREALPEYFAAAAKMATLAGKLDTAENLLSRGFEYGSAYGYLWKERARLQLARGQLPLAQASINYAMAIWEDADPEYFHFEEAQSLAADIAASGKRG